MNESPADEEALETWLAELLRDETDREYLVELSRLQVELLKLQSHVIDQGLRVAILFEGRDTAGKGGAILRFSQHLRPRNHRIVALAKPTESERGQWYFQRYVRQLPAPGEIVLFDRSWYNRAVVEPVMGFCSEEQHLRFMRQVVEFERMLQENGILLVKLWFSIDQEEQKRRLDRRKANPLKRWKLSTVDLQAQQQWQAFTRQKEKMFEQTSTAGSPWVVVQGNRKKRARLESIRHVLGALPYPDAGQPGLRLEPDPAIVRPVAPGTSPSETVGARVRESRR